MKQISEKQMIANKQNAKLGGVKTDEGKEKIKYNALKYGIFSKEVVLRTENYEDFQSFKDEIMNDLRPNGAMECLLVDRIISNSWRLKRVVFIENNLMTYQNRSFGEFRVFDGLDLDILNCKKFPSNKDEKLYNQYEEIKKNTDMISNDAIDKIIRYESFLERSIYKALEELRKLRFLKLHTIN